MVQTTQSPKVTTAAAEPPSLEELEQALRASWTPETSDDPAAWSPENPAAGQCVATTLVIQALYGGEIVGAEVLHDRRPTGREHAWNRLPSGEEVDFTFAQFGRGERLGAESPWTPDLGGNPGRVAVLAARVGRMLGVEIDVTDVVAGSHR